MIQGIYIDRKKNLKKELYIIDDQKSTSDKVVFIRNNTSNNISGAPNLQGPAD